MYIDYTRVIPRDLFNEAKLLKCIGRLVLFIHDGNRINNMTCEHDDNPFDIGLLEDGHLVVKNIHFIVNGQRLLMKSQYNSKRNYSLLCEHNYCEYIVFDDDGDYTQDFVEFCESIK